MLTKKKKKKAVAAVKAAVAAAKNEKILKVVGGAGGGFNYLGSTPIEGFSSSSSMKVMERPLSEPGVQRRVFPGTAMGGLGSLGLEVAAARDKLSSISDEGSSTKLSSSRSSGALSDLLKRGSGSMIVQGRQTEGDRGKREWRSGKGMKSSRSMPDFKKVMGGGGGGGGASMVPSSHRIDPSTILTPPRAGGVEVIQNSNNSSSRSGSGGAATLPLPSTKTLSKRRQGISKWPPNPSTILTPPPQNSSSNGRGRSGDSGGTATLPLPSTKTLSKRSPGRQGHSRRPSEMARKAAFDDFVKWCEGETKWFKSVSQELSFVEQRVEGMKEEIRKFARGNAKLTDDLYWIENKGRKELGG